MSSECSKFSVSASELSQLVSYVLTQLNCCYTEYNTGKASGKSLGFQTGGNLAPFPIVRSVSSPEQRARDYEYSSTDEDEDGINSIIQLINKDDLIN